jgi:hypothetical protein
MNLFYSQLELLKIYDVVFDQILLASNNPIYCILLALAIYLEVWMAAGQALGTQFLSDHAASPKTNKNYISDQYKACWEDPHFVRLVAGPLGSHSYRKFPATPPTLGVAGCIVGVVNNTATLSRNPRTLFILWQEYEFGIAGRKAAEKFTAIERGRVGYKYHRRKVVWDKVAELIRAGHPAKTAIDAILLDYGEGTPVTCIINLMRVQRTKAGGRPALAV